jgi:uncharacterized protein DUF6532
MSNQNPFVQIVNCLEEWQTGAHILIPFSGDRYESVYQDMVSLIDTAAENAYHGKKLNKLLMFIASDGRYVTFFLFIPFYIHIYHRKRAPRSRGNTGGHGFKVILD